MKIIENQGISRVTEGDTGMTLLMGILKTFCYKTMCVPADFIIAFFIRGLL